MVSTSGWDTTIMDDTIIVDTIIMNTCNIFLHDSIMLIVMMHRGSQTRFSTSHLSILCSGSMSRLGTSPSPEEPDSITRGIIVGWTWSECLVLAVASGQPDLHKRSNDEEECADDGHSKDCALHVAYGPQARGDMLTGGAGVAVSGTFTEGSADGLALARGGTVAGLDSNGDERSSECNVENDSKESKEHVTAEAAGQDDCYESIADTDARDTLDGAVLGWDTNVVG
jgi:hypothetical protein